MKDILLVVTGSIAAYKACEFTRLLIKEGFNVHVAMTEAATKFVGEVTFRTLSRNPVYIDQFAQPLDWRPEHVALAELCETAIVLPASADFIAKMAYGLADDGPSSVMLAHRGRKIVAPAMNDGMWEAPATKENIQKLQGRGVEVVYPTEGELACGKAGLGRLAPLEDILKIVKGK
ncbi:phosphopantothenoylcysteine decarboxylase [bacterium]|nr:phosphopantothenoylcysteine decarboxylase [bacterium]